MNKKFLYIILAALFCVALVLGIVVLIVSSGQSGINKPGSSPTPEPSLSTEIPEATAGPEETEEPTAEPYIPLAGLIIGIDAGHQAAANLDKEPCAPWGPEANPSVNNLTMKTKTTAGTEGKFTRVPEYVATLNISLKVRDKLEALGATVVMTRETHDVNISNIDRTNICNEAKCDVVVRIHCNGADNPDVSGVEAWIRGGGDGTPEYRELSEYERKLADELLAYFVNATDCVKRNVNKSDSYTGLNWSTVPSIILECGFMSNETEDNRLVSEEYQYKIADGIAEWLINSNALKR